MCIELNSENIFWWCAASALFVFFESMFIIGLNACFKGAKSVDSVTTKEHYTGMVFYMMAPKFFERMKHKWYTQNLWVCYKCMSLPYGMICFWSTALFLFGFHWIEIPLSIFNVFIVLSMNMYLYKKL